MPTPSKNNIAAIIVTFQPVAEFSNHCQALSTQVDHIIVVDNGSDSQSQEFLKTLKTSLGIHLICNEQNIGLAAAMNQGTEGAKRIIDQCQWILLLDHDSQLEENAIDVYAQTYNNAGNTESIATIGCNHIDVNSGELYYTIKNVSSKPWIERKTVITSGSLISLSVIEQLGPFREDLFIDAIDHEFCLRARKNGFKNILIVQPLLKHSMGNRKIISLLGIKITTTNYPPFRWYYMTRNRLIVCFRYLLSDPLWAVSRLFYFLGSIILMIIAEQERWNKLKQILLGAMDAITHNRKRNVVPPRM